MINRLDKYIKLNNPSDNRQDICRDLLKLQAHRADLSLHLQALREKLPDIKPDMPVYFFGIAGQMGARMLMKFFPDSFAGRFSKAFTGSMDKKQSISPEDVSMIFHIGETAVQRPSGIRYMDLVEERGILQALFLFHKEFNLGFDIDIQLIPIDQFTIEICEHAGLDPYNLLTYGLLLIFADENAADSFRNEISLIDDRYPDAFSRIGYISPHGEMRFHIDSSTGLLNRPERDELLRFLQEVT